MQPQQTQDKDNAPSFLQAKWFTPAISTLALVISIGGHAFTASNTVDTVSLSNRLATVENVPSLIQQSDTKQDQAMRALASEISKLQHTVGQLQARITKLETGRAPTESEDSMDHADDFKVLHEEANTAREAAASEKQPLVNGVNEKFDALIRQRIKAQWAAPAVSPGHERPDDDDIVVLQFAVDRSGWVTDVGIANTSGIVDFDDSVIDAALRMDSIPEIARASDKNYELVKTFRLAVSPAHLR